MPFKSKKRQREYAIKWRRSHPNYQKDYYRRFYHRFGRKQRPKKDLPVF